MIPSTAHRHARLRGRMPGSATVRRSLDDATAVALTFDDGPHPDGTPAVLDVLAAAEATATFFVLADAALARPDLVRAVRAAGHEVGLHADRHERLDRVRTVDLARRLVDARRSVEDVLGEAVTLHRPPFGRLSWAGARAAQRAQMDVVLWSHDPRDWEGPEGLAERVSASVAPGAIVLLHDGAETYEGQGATTAAAVAVALRAARHAGLRPVAVPTAAPRPGSS